MKRLVMMGLTRAGLLSDAQGVSVEVRTSEGPLEIRCTHDDAEQLIAALQALQAGLPPKEKPVVSWETAIDPVNQDAVIRARYADRTTQETRIPRTELAAIARFLDQASRRFASGAEMRQ